MDVITAGTTQTQQAAGKTNHTPEDVSDLIQNLLALNRYWEMG